MKFGINECIIFLFLVFNRLVDAKTICYEPSDEKNKFHFVWLGNPVDSSHKYNLRHLYRLADNYAKKHNENFEVNVWTDDNNINMFSEILSDTQFDLKVNNVSTLLEKEKPLDKALYEYLIKKQNYAAASDYIRMLAVRNNGGCYMDIGFEIKSYFFLEEDLLKTDNDFEKFYVLTGEAGYEPEDPRIEALAGKKVNLFNGFFAAHKNHKILELLTKEFSFKNDFFVKHRVIVDLLYEHCSSKPIVMSLIGQYAYEDFFRALDREKNPLYRDIVFLDLHASIPYSGKTSWLKVNDTDCDLVIGALYEYFHDPKLKTDLSNFIIDKNIDLIDNNWRPLDYFTLFYFPDFLRSAPSFRLWDESDRFISGSLTYGLDILRYRSSSSEAARRILIELLRYYREGKLHPAMTLLKEEDIKQLGKGIRAQKNVGISPERASKICIEELRKADPEIALGVKSHIHDNANEALPVIAKASLIKELNAKIHLTFYDQSFSSPFFLTNPNDLYFGHFMPFCGMNTEKNIDFPVFIPLFKIEPNLMQKIGQRKQKK